MVGVVYVRGEVFGEVVSACEAFAAHLAVVGSFARVNAQMPRQVALASKCSAAEQTCKRTFPCVFPDM